MITIHFIGLGVFVLAPDGTVSEILFPNGQTRKPPDGERLTTRLKHADNSVARRHYAGAIVLDPDENIVDRQPLIGRRVDFPASAPTRVDAGFRNAFPPLDVATGNRPIDLIPGADRNTGLVATRIKIAGGNPLAASLPTQGFKFTLPVLSGSPLRERFYATVATWTTNDATLELRTSKIWGAGKPQTIRLNATTRPEAYLFNFDVRDPELKDFKEDPLECDGPKIDHDFKWIFQVMTPRAPKARPWQDYLGSDAFPAPATNCTPHRIPKGQRLVPVSTCFPAVWDGP